MIYQLRQVSRTYGPAVRAVDHINVEIEDGEHLVFLGPSGAGKTTLLRLLNASVRPSSGQVVFDGVDLGRLEGAALRRTRSRIGMVYQQHMLISNVSVLNNVLVGALGRWDLWFTMRSLVAPNRRTFEEAESALETVGLQDKLRSRVSELSGGQQQRVAIARMLMQNPRVMIADEPVASLDPALAEEMINLLKSLAIKHSKTLLLSLHNVDLALGYGDRIVGLQRGKVILDTPPRGVSRADLEYLYRHAASAPSPPIPVAAVPGRQACSR